MRSLRGQSASETHQPLIHSSSSGKHNNNNRSHTTTHSLTHPPSASHARVCWGRVQRNESVVFGRRGGCVTWSKIWGAMPLQFWGPKNNTAVLMSGSCVTCVNRFLSEMWIDFEAREKSLICMQPVFLITSHNSQLHFIEWATTQDNGCSIAVFHCSLKLSLQTPFSGSCCSPIMHSCLMTSSVVFSISRKCKRILRDSFHKTINNSLSLYQRPKFDEPGFIAFLMPNCRFLSCLCLEYSDGLTINVQLVPPGRLDDAAAQLCEHDPQKFTWEHQRSRGWKHTASLLFFHSACLS